jgi:hypothetical protein
VKPDLFLLAEVFDEGPYSNFLPCSMPASTRRSISRCAARFVEAFAKN